VDLKNAGKGNGSHAYSFEVPATLKGTGDHTIYGRVKGSTFVLKDSGKSLNCSSGSRLLAEDTGDLQVVILGNPISGNAVEVEVLGAKGQPLRLQLMNTNGWILSDRQIEKAKPVEQLTMVMPNQPSGLLLLRVTSGLRSVSLKVLKQ
jgi:hypothetical protein